MSGQDADIAKLERRYQREKQARQEAERLFEEASRSLFEANQQLSRQAEQLEKLVLERTAQLRHSLGKAEEAMFQAEAASRAKTDFLAVMSHEIRTPLNGVLGMAELLALTSLNSEQRENVSTLLECGQSLLSLINDILELCRIDAGKLEIQSQPFDLSASLHSLCKLFTPKAQEKKLALTLRDIPPDCWIAGDEHRIRQVLGNLLGNAIKFTEQGGVILRMRRQTREDGALALAIEVEDSGIGMAPEVLEKLFQPFEQGDNSITRRYGGSGLGLAICHKVVKAMHGAIEVESQPGRGSVFRFLWTAHAAPGRAAPDEAVADSQDFSGLRVMVVEDNPINLNLISALLRKLGCGFVDLRPSAQAALAALRACEVDLILMDMQMPHMNGLEATRHIRAMSLPVQPHIAALTANAFAEDEAACREAGMDDFLTKPLPLPKLTALLSRVAALKKNLPA